MSESAQLPLYNCHKQVRALKIKELNWDNFGHCTLIPENTTFSSFRLPHEYMRKHKPESGGYYVVYEDGYTSYSPAEPFESGYTLAE